MNSSCNDASFALLELARHLRNTFFERSRVVHRAELGPAHTAKFGALEVFGGKGLVMVLLGPLRIEAKSELLLPIEGVAGAGKRIVTVPGSFAATRDVRRMRSDLVSDDALPHVLGVRQTQVFLRCDVAKHVGPEPADHRRP